MFLSSTQSNADIQHLILEIRSQCDSNKNGFDDESMIKLLYITPEKFSKSGQLQNLLQYLLNKRRLSRFVIDEAHCLSQVRKIFIILINDWYALDRFHFFLLSGGMISDQITLNSKIFDDYFLVFQSWH